MEMVACFFHLLRIIREYLMETNDQIHDEWDVILLQVLQKDMSERYMVLLER
jgi:hypothetical protein